MGKQNIRIVIGIVVGAFLILALLFRPRGRIKVDSGYRELMGTFARIVAVAADSPTAKKSIESAFAELQNVDKLMSDYKSDSEITKINCEAYEAPVRVSKSTFDVLQRAVYFSELSEGAFDITVGALVDLWRSAAEANSIPNEAELAAARSKVGYEKLILDANEMTVRFAVDGMRLDLGGIAKGYAIDKAIQAMQKCETTGGMVDVGGDIRCFGTSPRGEKHWLIGLQDPTQTEDWLGTSKPLRVLKLSDCAIATSGDYRRFALIEGKKYGHIIDSKTGYGGKGPASVTIICKSATDADALATAVSVMGAEKGLALIESLPETEAILVRECVDESKREGVNAYTHKRINALTKYELIKTTGAEEYLK